jgi:chorismate mutase / prephenate dehydratase
MSDEHSKLAELAKLRNEIDRIDRTMHELLLTRGRMISALQDAKGVGAVKGSGAMRPAREARMMMAMADRHEGPLPMAVAERIWREIIAAFTQLQAGFDVYAAGPDRVELAEMSRFYFGVTTSVTQLACVDDLIDKTQSDNRAVGFITGAIAGSSNTPWWVRLARMPDRQARIVARYPFFDGHEDAPWGREAWIVSQAPFEPSGDDCTLIVIEGAAAFETVTGGIDRSSVEVDRVLIDKETLILVRIEGYLSQGEIDGKIPAGVLVAHLGGYPRIGRKTDIVGNNNND